MLNIDFPEQNMNFFYDVSESTLDSISIFGHQYEYG